MTLDEALHYIHSVCWKGSVPGLERISALLDKMGHPERKLKFIHVTGTNGKGSTCAMLASMFTKAGYKTGLYTSSKIAARRSARSSTRRTLPISGSFPTI